MLETFRDFVVSLPLWGQWFGVMLIAAIPFVESYFGSAIGVVCGLSPFVAVPAAVIGNAVSMIVCVMSAAAVKSRRRPKEMTKRKAKFKKYFDRFGVPGVSLMGQTLLPSQITSMLMVGFGASHKAVIFWQIISIILWGVVFGALAAGGVALLG